MNTILTPESSIFAASFKLISLERQVRIAVGAIFVLGVVLAQLVHSRPTLPQLFEN